MFEKKDPFLADYPACLPTEGNQLFSYLNLGKAVGIDFRKASDLFAIKKSEVLVGVFPGGAITSYAGLFSSVESNALSDVLQVAKKLNLPNVCICEGDTTTDYGAFALAESGTLIKRWAALGNKTLVDDQNGSAISGNYSKTFQAYEVGKISGAAVALNVLEEFLGRPFESYNFDELPVQIFNLPFLKSLFR